MQAHQEFSYYALRRCPAAEAPAWWASARRRPDAPPAIVALLSGRRRVELSGDEASAALTWAETIDGWPTAGLRPVMAHPRDPRGVGGQPL
jgi:hypothetical protein